MIFARSVHAPFHVLKSFPDYNAEHRANAMSMAAILRALGMTGKGLLWLWHSGVSAHFQVECTDVEDCFFTLSAQTVPLFTCLC